VTIKIFPLNGEGPEKVRFFIQRSAGDEESLLMLQHWLSLSLGETKDSDDKSITDLFLTTIINGGALKI